MEAAVAGAIAPAAGVVEMLQETRDLAEILEALEVAFFNVAPFRVARALYESMLLSWAQEKTWGISAQPSGTEANGVPNRIGTVTYFWEIRVRIQL